MNLKSRYEEIIRESSRRIAQATAILGTHIREDLGISPNAARTYYQIDRSLTAIVPIAEFRRAELDRSTMQVRGENALQTGATELRSANQVSLDLARSFLQVLRLSGIKPRSFCGGHVVVRPGVGLSFCLHDEGSLARMPRPELPLPFIAYSRHMSWAAVSGEILCSDGVFQVRTTDPAAQQGGDARVIDAQVFKVAHQHITARIKVLRDWAWKEAIDLSGCTSLVHIGTDYRPVKVGLDSHEILQLPEKYARDEPFTMLDPTTLAVGPGLEAPVSLARGYLSLISDMTSLLCKELPLNLQMHSAICHMGLTGKWTFMTHTPEQFARIFIGPSENSSVEMRRCLDQAGQVWEVSPEGEQLKITAVRALTPTLH